MLSILDRSIDFDHLHFDQIRPSAGWHDDIDSFSELILEYVLDDDELVSETDNDQGSPYNSQGNAGSHFMGLSLVWACPEQNGLGLPSLLHLIESNSTPLPVPWMGVPRKGYRSISSPPPDQPMA